MLNIQGHGGYDEIQLAKFRQWKPLRHSQHRINCSPPTTNICHVMSMSIKCLSAAVESGIPGQYRLQCRPGPEGMRRPV